MSDDAELTPLSQEELAAEGGTALPDKELVSILDLNADLNLAIDAAAPIDLAVAANANVAAPIDAAVSANILSTGSHSAALSDQGVLLNQNIDADATANAAQVSDLDQSNDVVDAGAGATPDATAGTAAVGADTTTGALPDAGGTGGDATGAVPDPGDVGGAVGDAAGVADGALDGNLLNVDVNLDADADISAPIDGAVAANANVAAPIDAAVSANIGSADSDAVAVSQQDAIINQTVTGSAEANADQQSDITQ